MKEITKAMPTYVGDLGNGLVCRWSTSDDQVKIAQLMGNIFRDGPDKPFNHRAADVVRIVMSEGFPYMGPGDFAIVEDCGKPDRPVVAYACLWRFDWSYGEIPFGVGQPEMVATDAQYRNRGLVRALFEMIHARSSTEGHLVQAITGIPYFYRQFGYEFVLDLDGRWILPLTAIQDKAAGQNEPYSLRLAILDDIPQLMALYDQQRSTSLVWRETSAAFWRHHITSWDDPFVRNTEVTQIGLPGRLYMIVDDAGQAVGYTWLAAKRWDNELDVFALQLGPNTNWQVAVPCLLRVFREFGRQLPVIEENNQPFSAISLDLGRTHPIYAVLGESMAMRRVPPYAWYLRVPNVPGFIQHIAPVLEERLARSILSGYSGDLKVDFYNGGLRLHFDQGRLTAVEPWRAPAYGDEAHAGCPPLVFLQLLFCYRSLAELRAFFPDVWANPEVTLLIDILFPKQPSVVYPHTNV